MKGLEGIMTFSHSEYRLCEVDGQKALFHKWNDITNVVEASPMIGGTPAGEIKYTLGLVEFEDGHIEEVYPHRIVFKDGFVTKNFEENKNGGVNVKTDR